MALTALTVLFIGRFSELTPAHAVELFYALVRGESLTALQENQYIALIYVRLPRIAAALLVGAALAISGGAYQSMFMNPLVSPGILGVLAGASFGAGIGMVFFHDSWMATQILAFLFACVAVGFALFFSAFFRWRSILILLLGGIISASFFTSLTALMKFLADPEKQLPELTYWLMGSFARVEAHTILWVGIPMLLLTGYLCTQGKVTNVLSMGDEEALSMGVAVRAARLRIILCATLLSAFTVVLVGIVGWVGLVIPHIMRFLTGPDNRILLPASAMAGAIFLLVTDSIARTVFTAELPIGVYTSLVSLPVFVVSLYMNRRSWQ
ncbi:iron ABC transporter permease [Oxalobacter vibrioformis]|uniref:Iron ABC transporter permease n=1 Tax=Oxalobacter vibrioformis TaxID=933080 RepID=A0A9E9P3K6_9BURK|nr:iron ABC transporter permease [Oxalobacter vibrioformis]WAW10123.1 iron ABC transporter permease [Oxalobacter vibrioformis]